MIASIVVSIYIIYLYRKLNAPKEAPATNGANAMSAINAEIASVNQKLYALEARLPSGRTG